MLQVQPGAVPGDVRGADVGDGGLLHGNGQGTLGQSLNRRTHSETDRLHQVQEKGNTQHLQRDDKSFRFHLDNIL